MTQVQVLDRAGRRLSPCSVEKAQKLLAAGQAEVVAAGAAGAGALSAEPFTIRLNREVVLPERESAPEPPSPLAGRSLLLHVCCAPCATYSVQRLRQEGATVTGHWFNPNVHPFSEHERRRETLRDYAGQIDLPVVWEPEYEVVAFMRAVASHEAFGERCRICYALRLERTARAAAERGDDWFSTTLLISPYQDQAAIREIGEALGHRYGVPFYFENLRRGFAAHHAMAREAGLYRQRYCGCLYSEWEALQAAGRGGREAVG
jgi:predicted adenine nucleotide alpha hydrolase (AANH) superfamily ATPase